MTGTICSVTGEACQCTGKAGCARRRKQAAKLRVALGGQVGVRLTLQEVERGLQAKRPYPGPELREAMRLAAALETEIKRIAEDLEQ